MIERRDVEVWGDVRAPDLMAPGQVATVVAGVAAYWALVQAERKLLHTWIIFVVVEQYLVQTSRIEGPIEYLS